MSGKSAKIAALIDSCRGKEFDPHYLGYFECFNRQLFYEAHDVLEELWLTDRHGRHGDFYKGLIQFAGAFVHLQKDCARYPRLRPAAALFKLAQGYLRPYAPEHERLAVSWVLQTAALWQQQLERDGYTINPLLSQPPPELKLLRGEDKEVEGQSRGALG